MSIELGYSARTNDTAGEEVARARATLERGLEQGALALSIDASISCFEAAKSVPRSAASPLERQRVGQNWLVLRRTSVQASTTSIPPASRRA